jgi:hypothetical protein
MVSPFSLSLTLDPPVISFSLQDNGRWSLQDNPLRAGHLPDTGRKITRGLTQPKEFTLSGITMIVLN